MAVEEDGDKKNTDDESVDDTTKPKNKKPWLLIGIVIFLVTILIAGSVLGVLYFAGIFDAKQQIEMVNAKNKKEGQPTDEDVEDEEVAEAEDEDEDDSEGDEDEQKRDAIYVPIESTFVVNFEGVSKIRFLQVTVELMTRDEKVVESLNTHMPVIRNNLTLLFSSRSFEDVNTVEGKQQLRALALTEVQKIMEAETGDSAVEALYFTSFVTQ